MEIGLNEIITDPCTLQEGYVFRDGFVFTYGQRNPPVFNRLVVRSPQRTRASERKMGYSYRTLEEHIALINQLQITHILAICDDLSFLLQCPSVTDVTVAVSYDATGDFDYSPVYKLPNLRHFYGSTLYGTEGQYRATIDYEAMPGLRSVTMNGPGHLGYGELRELQEIWMINFKGISEFDGLLSSQELERVTIMTSSIKDLTGVGNHPRLTSLALHNNHSLRDISGLAEVKASLTTLAIDCCGKIRDFSVLEQLENLEFLQLDGNNTLPNLNFLRRMPRLKCFSFTMNVADGDLRPCLDIPQAYCRDRKHFNLKNIQLPKGQT